MDIYKTLVNCGAILKGHFCLASGLHSDTYIQCALLFQYPDITQKVVSEFKNFINEKVDVVVSPALGGIIFGYELARLYSCRAVFLERESGILKLRRGFSISEGEKILIAEDVITTGGTVQEIISVLSPYVPKIVSIFSIVNRSGKNKINKTEIKSLIKLDIKNYTDSECPLCKSGVPLEKPGSKILSRKHEK